MPLFGEDLSLARHSQTHTLILPPTTTPRSRQELSTFVVASIEAMGLKVPAPSRLRQMYDLHHDGQGTIEPSHPDFEIALEAERDLQLLAFAFDLLGVANPSDAYRQLVRKVVSDSVLPQHDLEHSKGRDAAFELHVGAICTSAQLLPVAFEEPDITCVWNNVRYGFAAKRIKSAKNLLANVRKAVDQILRSAIPGVIVLDTCMAFNPSNTRITEPMPDVLYMDRHFNALRMMWSEYNPEVQRLISRANVLGLIVHDYQVRFQSDRQWALAGMTMIVPAERQTKVEQRRFDALAALYKYAMPNQEDVSEPKVLIPDAKTVERLQDRL